MYEALPYFLFQIAGYLIGGIPFGYLIAKLTHGVDIRSMGSGNIGATNVGRNLGFRFFILVFLLDFLKGALPTLAATYFVDNVYFEWEGRRRSFLFIPELTGLAAILGHMFPIYLGGNGGKGVATSLGVFSVILPAVTAVGIGAFLVVFLFTGMVSAGSIAMALTMAITYVARLGLGVFELPNLAKSSLIGLAALLVIFGHRTNIRRILDGTESRVEFPWSRRKQSAPRAGEDQGRSGDFSNQPANGASSTNDPTNELES